jgi:hypothetical protein
VKIFKLEEANAMLPTLRPLLQTLCDRRRALAIAQLEADIARGFRESVEVSAPRRRHVRALQDGVLEMIETIHRHGCTVKDVDLGLVDFLALRGGRLVNLCWKMDEQHVSFWHGLDEGFADRKSVVRRRA